MAGDLEATGTNPSVIWNVDGGTSDDWRVTVASGNLQLQHVGGTWTDLFRWISGVVVSNVPVEIAHSAPKLTFTDTDSNDFRLAADAGVFALEAESAGTFNSVFEWASTQVTSKVDFRVLGTTPRLTLEDSDTSAPDFRLLADGDVLNLGTNNSGSYVAVFEWTDLSVKSYQNMTIAGAAPTLTLDNTTFGQTSFRLRTASDNLYIDANTGSWVSVLECDSSLIYGTNDIVVGHGILDGGVNQAFHVRLYSGSSPSSGASTLLDLGTEFVNKVISVLFMMSKTGAPYTYDVYDFRSSANNGFYVEVQPNESSGTPQDRVLVTFDPGYRSAVYEMVAFFLQG